MPFSFRTNIWSPIFLGLRARQSSLSSLPKQFKIQFWLKESFWRMPSSNKIRIFLMEDRMDCMIFALFLQPSMYLRIWTTKSKHRPQVHHFWVLCSLHSTCASKSNVYLCSLGPLIATSPRNIRSLHEVETFIWPSLLLPSVNTSMQTSKLVQ